jgi:hypothetical protein
MFQPVFLFYMSVLTEVELLVKWHLEKKPKMGVFDVYKLLYQGVFGVGHILSKGAQNYLLKEALELKDIGVEEPFTEPVSPDGEMVRVNLRPYLKHMLPLEKLFNAMVVSSVEGNPTIFLERWDAFVKLAGTRVLVFNFKEIDELNAKINREKPQPMHHSTEYREAYHPSYRVVKNRVLMDMGLSEVKSL